MLRQCRSYYEYPGIINTYTTILTSEIINVFADFANAISQVVFDEADL